MFKDIVIIKIYVKSMYYINPRFIHNNHEKGNIQREYPHGNH